MRRPAAIFALGALAALTPAHSAVTVFGNSDAYACYRAAEDERGDAGALSICDHALADRALRMRDRVASYVNRGIVLAHSGRLDSAIADYDRAIALDADEPEAYLNKGLALLRGNESADQAVSLLTTAIDRGTNEPAIAYYSRGIANEIAGDIPAAYRDLVRASQLAPEWEAPARDLARFEVVEGSED